MRGRWKVVVPSNRWRSCTNVVSACAVKRLGLPTLKLPNPYTLQWHNDHGSIKVMKQALMKFEIGGYKDEILCDVVPVQAAHILLGRPWQFDRQAQHDGVTN
ncbi:unnamed protein product [Linum trigynum]|uniref:Uncharacterized protein n=1 Tax=Linum trigynum TaxID=586398 RepID=A0AAV2FVL1_9ROSI